MSKRVAIVGAGTMGTALQTALQPDNLVTMITRDSFSTVSWDQFDVICFAIKPQDFKLLTPLPLAEKLIISVMAGISTTQLHTTTNSDQIIRTMPNTPIKIGLGMTAWCKTKAVTQLNSQWFQNAFSKVSKLLDVNDDDGINKATVVSASGPGFLFATLESYMLAAQQLGFSEADARLLVTQTMIGSAELLKQSGLSAAELRQHVISKGGTTAAGLAIMEKANQWLPVLQAAYQRAKELSQ